MRTRNAVLIAEQQRPLCGEEVQLGLRWALHFSLSSPPAIGFLFSFLAYFSCTFILADFGVLFVWIFAIWVNILTLVFTFLYPSGLVFSSCVNYMPLFSVVSKIILCLYTEKSLFLIELGSAILFIGSLSLLTILNLLRTSLYFFHLSLFWS